MSTNTVRQLLADGFKSTKDYKIAIPHFVWKIDIEIEYDRQLRLVEETILGLVEAGVGSKTVIADLMGLKSDGAVSSALIALMQRGVLLNDNDQLQITSLGEAVLLRATTRETVTCPEVQVRHDPYRDRFCWSFEDVEYKEHQLKERSLIPLPVTGELLSEQVEARYREIHALVENNGLPYEDGADVTGSRRQRDVVSIVPVHRYVAYREGVLEAWMRSDTEELQWRILRGGAEDIDVSRRLMEIEAEDGEVLPAEERRQLQPRRSSSRSHRYG